MGIGVPKKPPKKSLNIGVSDEERAEIEEYIEVIRESGLPKYTITEFIREAILDKMEVVKQLQCPKCKRLNSRFARYCNQCGMPLTEEKIKVREELDALVKENQDLFIKILEEMKK